MHTCRVDIHIEGLQDNCAGCEAHAEKPWSGLDQDMLYNLIERNCGYRYGKRSDCNPRSDNEEMAMNNITNVMERMGALFEADTPRMVDYLQTRWNTNIVIVAN